MSVLPVGVDIATATFTVAVWLNGTGHTVGTFPNSVAGMEACATELARYQDHAHAAAIHLVLEPTAGFELPLAGFATQRGWRVSMPTPVQVRDWARGVGRRAKTDAQDAIMLARSAAEQPTRLWRPLSIPVSERESLLRRQDDLEHLLHQERNRQRFLSSRPGTASAVGESIARVIEDLERARAAIRQAIRDHLRAYPDLARAARRLRTVPGIGERTVLWLLVLLHRWQTLTAGHGRATSLVASVGLDPRPYESGSSVSRRATISRMGAAHLRRRLFVRAFGGVRGANALRLFYERLVGRGKPKLLALVAAARKLLTWAWAVFRTECDFNQQKARDPMLAT